MRDLDRVKDKIEILLDPRQVVMLVIGTTAVAGGLFAGGYVMGEKHTRQVVASERAAEQRGDLASIDAATRAPAAEAATNDVHRPAALGEVEFAFPSMLNERAGAPVQIAPEVLEVRRPAAREPAPKPAPQPMPAVVATAPRPAPVAPAPLAEDEPEPDVPLMPPPVEAAVAAVAAPAVGAAPAVAAAPAEAPKPSPVIIARGDDDDVPPPPAPDEIATEDSPDAAAAPIAAAAPEGQPAPAPAEATGDGDEPEAVAREEAKPRPAARHRANRLTLQVKSVPEKSEADAFAARLRAAGFEPYIVLADIPGKGRWYRVRVGRFDDMEAAKAFQRRYKAESGQADAGFITRQ